MTERESERKTDSNRERLIVTERDRERDRNRDRQRNRERQPKEGIREK